MFPSHSFTRTFSLSLSLSKIRRYDGADYPQHVAREVTEINGGGREWRVHSRCSIS